MTRANSLPRVAVAALGGTIAMSNSAEQGLVPTLTAENLLRAVPGAGQLASVHAESLAGLPSASLQLSDLLRVLAWAHQRADEGYQAIVITQGTDTLEDSAFFFELCWSRSIPVIFTAAMRGATAVSADGPANLLSALLTATNPVLLNHSTVLVLLNDTLHSPRFATKSHTLALDTFSSLPIGPVGAMVEGQPVFFHGIPKRAAVPASVRWSALALPNALPEVAIVATWPGDDGRVLQAFTDHGYAALVVQGMGAGHVSAAFAQALEPVAARLPVVVSTRVPFGPTTQATYAYPGSEKHLQELGAVMAGWLSPHKARLALACLHAAGMRGRPLLQHVEALGRFPGVA